MELTSARKERAEVSTQPSERPRVDGGGRGDEQLVLKGEKEEVEGYQ